MTTLANERRSLAFRAQRRTHQGGAAMVEYSILLFAVLICAAGAIKTVGPSVACAGANATDSLSSGIGGGGCAEATASAGGPSGSGAAAAGSSGGGASGGADEGARAGSGGGGDVASSSNGDDGTGGFMGGSGSSNGNLGSGSATGSSGSGSANGSGGAVASSTSDNGSATNGAPSFASQVTGTTPKQIDLTLAKLSDDVYGDKNAQNQKGADGYRPLTSAELAKAGITQSMLRDKNSGFVADVYTNGNGDYVVAYRGTASLSGWKTDAQQALGYQTAQYSEAERLGKAAKAAFGNNVVLTGHSLGGGLAASTAAATGVPAVTFNAAGVNDKTLIADGVDPGAARAQANNGQVRRYEVSGDILTGSQEGAKSVLAQPLGRVVVVQDPNGAITAADRGIGPGASLMRSVQLHSDYTSGMEAHPVIYQGANGKPATYQFNNPNNPS